MSVLIKGMEMPHDCDECKLCAFIPIGDYGINRKCMPLNARAEICIRRSDCPLVPVPDHGRLIDADALMETFRERKRPTLSDGADGSKERVRYLDFISTLRAIKDAPTIIPAEEDE